MVAFYMEILIAVLFIFSFRFLYGFYQKKQHVGELKESTVINKEPSLGNLDTLYEDEIIAVRKKAADAADETSETHTPQEQIDTMALYVMAEKNKPFLGYDLLQILLSQGLKYGEMKIFHRYQETNGKGPRLFSVASAAEPGTFDIHQMGAQSYRGLTLFMQFSGSAGIDKERFSLMCATAQELADTLKGSFLNHKKIPLTTQTANEYREKIIESINALAVA